MDNANAILPISRWDHVNQNNNHSDSSKDLCRSNLFMETAINEFNVRTVSSAHPLSSPQSTTSDNFTGADKWIDNFTTTSNYPSTSFQYSTYQSISEFPSQEYPSLNVTSLLHSETLIQQLQSPTTQSLSSQDSSQSPSKNYYGSNQSPQLTYQESNSYQQLSSHSNQSLQLTFYDHSQPPQFISPDNNQSLKLNSQGSKQSPEQFHPLSYERLLDAFVEVGWYLRQNKNSVIFKRRQLLECALVNNKLNYNLKIQSNPEESIHCCRIFSSSVLISEAEDLTRTSAKRKAVKIAFDKLTKLHLKLVSLKDDMYELISSDFPFDDTVFEDRSFLKRHQSSVDSSEQVEAKVTKLASIKESNKANIDPLMTKKYDFEIMDMVKTIHNELGNSPISDQGEAEQQNNHPELADCRYFNIYDSSNNLFLESSKKEFNLFRTVSRAHSLSTPQPGFEKLIGSANSDNFKGSDKLIDNCTTKFNHPATSFQSSTSRTISEIPSQDCPALNVIYPLQSETSNYCSQQVQRLTTQTFIPQDSIQSAQINSYDSNYSPHLSAHDSNQSPQLNSHDNNRSQQLYSQDKNHSPQINSQAFNKSSHLLHHFNQSPQLNCNQYPQRFQPSKHQNLLEAFFDVGYYLRENKNSGQKRHQLIEIAMINNKLDYELKTDTCPDLLPYCCRIFSSSVLISEAKDFTRTSAKRKAVQTAFDKLTKPYLKFDSLNGEIDELISSDFPFEDVFSKKRQTSAEISVKLKAIVKKLLSSRPNLVKPRTERFTEMKPSRDDEMNLKNAKESTDYDKANGMELCSPKQTSRIHKQTPIFKFNPPDNITLPLHNLFKENMNWKASSSTTHISSNWTAYQIKHHLEKLQSQSFKGRKNMKLKIFKLEELLDMITKAHGLPYKIEFVKQPAKSYLFSMFCNSGNVSFTSRKRTPTKIKGLEQAIAKFIEYVENKEKQLIDQEDPVTSICMDPQTNIPLKNMLPNASDEHGIFTQDQYDKDERKKLDVFIIFEQETDKQLDAYSILYQSCYFNKVNLIPKFVEQLQDGQSYKRCSLLIDEELLFEADGATFVEAKNTAAVLALKNLKALMPTIRVKDNINNNLVTRAELFAEENKDEYTYDNDEYIYDKDIDNIMVWRDGSLGNTGENSIEENENSQKKNRHKRFGQNPIDSYRDITFGIIYDVICKFKMNLYLDDLEFDFSFSKKERLIIRQVSRQLNLKPDLMEKDNKYFMVVNRKRTPRELLRNLMDYGGSTSKYELIIPKCETENKL